MDILVHIANVFLLISFSSKSMLQLRALNIVAGGFFIAWALSFDEPLWAPVAWNTLFSLVNVRRIWLAILERRPPVLSAEEQQLKASVFESLEPRAFRKLLDVGQWENGLPPEMLVKSGEMPSRLWMVTEGCIEVRRDERIIREITTGDFVGETAFLADKPMVADMIIRDPVRCMSWPVDGLQKFMGDEPEIGAALQRIFGQCLVRKLNAA